MARRLACCCLLLALVVPVAAGQLYVVNALSEDITVIDTATDTVAGRIPLGGRGYHVAVAGGTKGYVTSSPAVMLGVADTAAGQPALLTVDLAARRVTATLPLPLSPLAAVHLAPGGRQACVVTAGAPGKRNEEPGRVLVVDLARRRVARTIAVGRNPVSSALSPDGRVLYTADWGSSAISIVNVPTGVVKRVDLAGGRARSLALRPDGRVLYAAVEPAAGVAVGVPSSSNVIAQTGRPAVAGAALWEIDPAGRVLGRLPLDGLGAVYALAADGRRVYAYGLAGAAQPVTQQVMVPRYELLAVDPARRSVVRRYGDFGFLAGIAPAPGGRKLYLIGTPGPARLEQQVQSSNAARVQSLPTQSPAQKTANVHSLLSDLGRLPKTVTVLDLVTGRRGKQIPVGSLPQGHAVGP